MDLNGKDPVIDSSVEWLGVAQPVDRDRSSDRHRTYERHRVRRRRSRKQNDIRAKIRRRVWLTCTGALIVMTIALYLALGRERGGEAGQLHSAPSDALAFEATTASRAG